MSRSATATKNDVVRRFFEPRPAEIDLGIIAVEQQYLDELRKSLERAQTIRIRH